MNELKYTFKINYIIKEYIRFDETKEIGYISEYEYIEFSISEL